jgi:mono/diheme cytochrome c family protein
LSGTRFAQVSIVLLGLVLASQGAAILDSRLTVWRHDASIDALKLSIVGPSETGPAWLDDQMDHGDVLPLPASMTTGLPEKDFHRLSVEIKISNDSTEGKVFALNELKLRSTLGKEWSATPREFQTSLKPGQEIYLFAYFDLPPLVEELRFIWIRGDRREPLMVVSHPPEHEGELRRDRNISWPNSASELPIGDPSRGKILYSSKCWGCHGHLLAPGSNTLGPHLGRIGEVGTTRVPGKTAGDYIYQSLLDPNAFIAPECKDGPCVRPSLMPSYARTFDQAEMSDVIAYLLTSAK